MTARNDKRAEVMINIRLTNTELHELARMGQNLYDSNNLMILYKTILVKIRRVQAVT